MLAGHIEVPRGDSDAMRRALAAASDVKTKETSDDTSEKTLVRMTDAELNLDQVIGLANAIARTGLRAELTYTDGNCHRRFDILCKTAVCLKEDVVLVPDKATNESLVCDEAVFQCLLGHEYMRQSAKLQKEYRRD